MSHAIHDFTAKLRQPALLPRVEAYIQWRRAVRAARAAGQPDPPPIAEHAPLSINLDLTTACNYRCDHCIDWDILNSAYKHREQELMDSLRVMAERGMRSVILIGGGEPSIHPRFVEFVTFLKELDQQVAIVSNGSRGDRLLEVARLFDENDWIRLSLDSGSNELFRDMHNPTDKKIDLDSICEWIPKIKAANPKPRVGFSYIIVWEGAEREADAPVHENIHEVVLATKRAKQYGFDYISLKPFLERTPEGAEIMDPEAGESELGLRLKQIRAAVDEAKTHATDDFQVFESTNLRLLESGKWVDFTKQPKNCHIQALRQVLTPTGLYNCPAHRGVEKAKIADQEGFKDADCAEATTANLSKLMDDFDASHECREVTCIYNKVNWWLEQKIDDPSAPGLLPSEEREDYFL
jgi:hypothetical protein